MRVFSELPPTLDLSTCSFLPQQILERRLVKKGNAAVPQIKVRWSGLSDDAVTWEDYYVLQQCYPEAEIWKEAASQGGEGVASPSPTNMVTDTSIDPG